jgi:protein-disulfide isomerase
VTLVEYGDFECPYCGQAYPILKNIQKQIGGDMRFVFRNFPITRIHPYAQNAAGAAEAAGAQYRFWEMHDRLFEHQRELGDNQLKRHASAIGIDVAIFENEMSRHAHASRVREDFMSGIRSGVNGTPTFYINGKCYDNSWDEETLLATIKQEISDRQHASSSRSGQRGKRRTGRAASNRAEHKG